MHKHFNITIIGKVQGVYYRANALEQAQSFGINGFVRNEKNGNVYVEAEGTEEKLNTLIAWCKRGPTRAVVKEVIVTEGEMQNFIGFEIRKG